MDDWPRGRSHEACAWMLKETKTIEPRAGSPPGLKETEEEGSWVMGLGLCQKSSGEPLKCFPQGAEMIIFMLCKDLPLAPMCTFYII